MTKTSLAIVSAMRRRPAPSSSRSTTRWCRAALNNGNAYTNVHTTTYPNGEIRGQIIRQQQ